MNIINKFSNEQIREIADTVDMCDIHNCKYRENWFAFRQNALEEYVRREMEYKYSESE